MEIVPGSRRRRRECSAVHNETCLTAVAPQGRRSPGAGEWTTSVSLGRAKLVFSPKQQSEDALTATACEPCR